MSILRKYWFVILFLFPFLQGCGLAGAYIYFGDKNYNSYLEAKKNLQHEEAQDYLSHAYGNYKDSLTYDETRYPIVYKKLADTDYLLNSRPSNCISWLKKGLSLVPDEAELKAALGKYTFFEAKKKKDLKILNEAKDHYRAALLASPINPDYNAGLMKVFFHEIETNRFNAKESKNKYLFSQLDELFENVVGEEAEIVDEARGVYAYIKGDYKVAIEKLTEVLKRSTNEVENHRTRYYLTRSYVETRRFNEAIELANQILTKDPEDYIFLGERVLAFLLRGDKSAAALDINTMEKIAKEYHEFYYRLGKYYYSQNNSKKANLYLLKAYRLDGSNGNYAFALGENYLLEGNSRAAAKFFQKSRQLAPPSSDLEKKSQQRLTEIGN